VARSPPWHVIDLGAQWDAYTSEITHATPHPRAFRSAVSAIGVDDPGACVYVGDRPCEGIHGAQ
jgi:putative hydrolase of the HAD superfamily